MARDDRLMNAMYGMIKGNKRVKRVDIRKQLKISITTYNRIKSHFEEEYEDCKYNKDDKEWIYAGDGKKDESGKLRKNK